MSNETRGKRNYLLLVTLTRWNYIDTHSTTLSNTVHCSHSDHVAGVTLETSDGGVGSGHIALVRGTVKSRWYSHIHQVVLNLYIWSSGVSGWVPLKSDLKV